MASEHHGEDLWWEALLGGPRQSFRWMILLHVGAPAWIPSGSVSPAFFQRKKIPQDVLHSGKSLRVWGHGRAVRTDPAKMNLQSMKEKEGKWRRKVMLEILSNQINYCHLKTEHFVGYFLKYLSSYLTFMLEQMYVNIYETPLGFCAIISCNWRGVWSCKL